MIQSLKKWAKTQMYYLKTALKKTRAKRIKIWSNFLAHRENLKFTRKSVKNAKNRRKMQKMGIFFFNSKLIHILHHLAQKSNCLLV